MIFASFVFVAWFLPLFLAAYFALPVRARNAWLTIGSFLFYAWARPPYVLLMLASTLLDWWCARAMGGPRSGRNRKLYVWVSVVTNLSLLGWFKYSNLLVETWNAFGIIPVAWTEVFLPVGISFYTFQSLSYTIDVYRGDVRAQRSLPDLLCFVSMFPQLVAGPIVRYRDIAAQLRNRTVDLVKFSSGVLLFMMGFAKKVLVADQVAPLADRAFAMATPGLLESWTGVTAYAVQIYFDFSGYSDMAVGLGLMLGFHFPANFLSPYRAHSITEFWRRWHVSLSTWLRDYLYVPLGGNRLGAGRTYVNLLLTMLLGGLWHGAQWTFLLWGAYQGLLLAFERRLGKSAPYGFLPLPLQAFCTFVLVLFGWAIFRAEDMATLGVVWGGMVGVNGLGAVLQLDYLTGLATGVLVLGLGIAWLLPRSEQLVMRCQPIVMLGTVALFLLALVQLLASKDTPFLYWRF
ncbi:MAG: Peptidoglycan O-acetyltransferase [Planctomycetota bacterium]